MSALNKPMIGWALLTLGCFVAAARGEPTKRGGLVLQFDDGWSSWRSLVAPELARVGGRATAFVNNQNIHSGRLSFNDLRALQNEFGWEIGSHTFNHLNAVRYVQQHGLKAWADGQLDRSLSELRGAGLSVSNLVFPFNVYAPEISRAALERGLGSYRRADGFALAAGRRPDGSLPGTSIDLTRYVPLTVLKEWVDMAHERGEVLFLYGHRVLPDSAFVTGRVVQVSAHELLADAEVTLPPEEDLVLVLNLARRSPPDSVVRLTVAEGRRIRVPESGPDLTRLAAPGSTFLIGSMYGTRLSDFSGLISYAAERLTFYTVSDIVSGRHVGAGPAAAQPQGAGAERGPK